MIAKSGKAPRKQDAVAQPMTINSRNRIRQLVPALWAGMAALVFSSCICCTAQATELLFYSSVPRNLSESLVKAFEAKNPNVAVKIFQTGTETVLEKIELEIKGKGRPEADVLWIQERAAMERLAERGLLTKYLATGHEAIDDRYKDSEGRWIGTFVTHVILMYNERAFKAQRPPHSWPELAEPRFRNKLTFANPRVSGTGAAVVSALVQNFGWPYIEKIAANKPQIASSHPAMISTVVMGERTVGPMQDVSVFEAMAKKQPIGFAFPTEGAVAVPAFAAIAAHTAKMEEAKKFIDFFASKDAADLLRAQGMYHTRNDARPPEGWPGIADIKTMKLDWARHEAEKEEIKNRFADLVER
jgi:iron(III) transport system substrate-binding protein